MASQDMASQDVSRHGARDRVLNRPLYVRVLGLAGGLLLLAFTAAEGVAESAGPATKKALLDGARLIGRGAAYAMRWRQPQ